MACPSQTRRPRLRRLFLEALDGAFGSDRPFTSNWLAALVEVSPKYIEFKDDRSHDFFFVDNLSRLNRVLWKALEPSNSYERFGLFAKVAEGAKDLVLLSDFFRMRVGDVNPDGAKRERDEAYFGTRTPRLQDILVKRVRSVARKGTFWKQSDPGRLLWFWWGADFGSEVHSFTDNAMNTKKGLRALFEVLVSTVISTSGNYEHVSRKQWSKVVDIEELARRAKTLLEQLPESDADYLRAKRFLTALERGEKDPFS